MNGTSLQQHNSYVNMSTVRSSEVAPVTCEGCGYVIEERYYAVLLPNSHECWHFRCLICCVCRKSLHQERSCYYRSGKIYCGTHYLRHFPVTCGGCQQRLCKTDLVQRFHNEVYHEKCFQCHVCQRVLRQGEQFCSYLPPAASQSAAGGGGYLLCWQHAPCWLMPPSDTAEEVESSLHSPGTAPDTGLDRHCLTVSASTAVGDSNREQDISQRQHCESMQYYNCSTEQQQDSPSITNTEFESNTATTRGRPLQPFHSSFDGSTSSPTSPYHHLAVPGHLCGHPNPRHPSSNTEPSQQSMVSSELGSFPGSPLPSSPQGDEATAEESKSKRPLITKNNKHVTKSSRGKGHKVTRMRTVLLEKQLQTLRTCYRANPRPDALMKEQLVEMTGLSARVIRVWFQNRRCKDKKRQIFLKQQQQQQVPVIGSSFGTSGSDLYPPDSGLKSSGMTTGSGHELAMLMGVNPIWTPAYCHLDTTSTSTFHDYPQPPPAAASARIDDGTFTNVQTSAIQDGFERSRDEGGGFSFHPYSGSVPEDVHYSAGGTDVNDFMPTSTSSFAQQLMRRTMMLIGRDDDQIQLLGNRQSHEVDHDAAAGPTNVVSRHSSMYS